MWRCLVWYKFTDVSDKSSLWLFGAEKWEKKLASSK
jgi:hypothetical protein